MINKVYMIKTDSRIQDPNNLMTYGCTSHDMKAYSSLKKAQRALAHEKAILESMEYYFFPALLDKPADWSGNEGPAFRDINGQYVQEAVYIQNPGNEFIYWDGSYWVRTYIIGMELD